MEPFLSLLYLSVYFYSFPCCQMVFYWSLTDIAASAILCQILTGIFNPLLPLLDLTLVIISDSCFITVLMDLRTQANLLLCILLLLLGLCCISHDNFLTCFFHCIVVVFFPGMGANVTD